jgi:hypothetical protein
MHSMMLASSIAFLVLFIVISPLNKAPAFFVPYQLSGVHLIGDDGLRGSHWMYAPPGALA